MFLHINNRTKLSTRLTRGFALSCLTQSFHSKNTLPFLDHFSGSADSSLLVLSFTESIFRIMYTSSLSIVGTLRRGTWEHFTRPSILSGVFMVSCQSFSGLRASRVLYNSSGQSKSYCWEASFGPAHFSSTLRSRRSLARKSCLVLFFMGQVLVHLLWSLGVSLALPLPFLLVWSCGLFLGDLFCLVIAPINHEIDPWHGIMRRECEKSIAMDDGWMDGWTVVVVVVV